MLRRPDSAGKRLDRYLSFASKIFQCPLLLVRIVYPHPYPKFVQPPKRFFSRFRLEVRRWDIGQCCTFHETACQKLKEIVKKKVVKLQYHRKCSRFLVRWVSVIFSTGEFPPFEIRPDGSRPGVIWSLRAAF